VNKNRTGLLRPIEGVKNTRRGGGLNCVFGNLKFLLSYRELIRVCSGLENKTQLRITLKVERKRER
jgi:hypothetical protein